MTKTKAQLRAEAVERLKQFEPRWGGDLLDALLDGEKSLTSWKDNRDALIDMLTDDCVPCYACSKLAELRAENNALHVKLDEQERADVSQTVEDAPERVTNQGEMLHDTREKLEEEILDAGCADEIDYDRIIGWLDRQAAITSAEWERATDVVKAERDEWKAKAEGYAEALEKTGCSVLANGTVFAPDDGVKRVMTNLDWLMENDFEALQNQMGGQPCSCCLVGCEDDLGSDEACDAALREWLMSPHEDEGDESCRQDAEQPERVESADCESDSREKLGSDLGSGSQVCSEADSREKLEADVQKYLDLPANCRGWGDYKAVCAWLDRQAAITHSIDAWNIERLEKRIAELQARVDELTAQLEAAYAKNRSLRAHISKMQEGRHGWHVKYPELEKKNAELEAERDEWKAKAEQAECAMNKAAGNWCKADDKAGYWKSEVEECLKAARIESVSEGMMAYPRHEGHTAPSLLVRLQFGYLDQLCVDLQAKLNELTERKCPGYEPESHYCRYHNQDFELNHQTVSRLKRENAELARDLHECMAENEKLKAGLLPQSDDEGLA